MWWVALLLSFRKQWLRFLSKTLNTSNEHFCDFPTNVQTNPETVIYNEPLPIYSLVLSYSVRTTSTTFDLVVLQELLWKYYCVMHRCSASEMGGSAAKAGTLAEVLHPVSQFVYNAFVRNVPKASVFHSTLSSVRLNGLDTTSKKERIWGRTEYRYGGLAKILCGTSCFLAVYIPNLCRIMKNGRQSKCANFNETSYIVWRT